MRVTNCPNIFVDQGQFSDPDFISGTHQRENVQFVDKSFKQMRKREQGLNKTNIVFGPASLQNIPVMYAFFTPVLNV